MGALKALVIGMGLLLVAGLVALAYGLYYKASHPDFKLFDDTKALPAGHMAPASAFGDLSVPLPPGCHIVDMEATGARLYLRSDCDTVVVVDTARGTVLGTIGARPR